MGVQVFKDWKGNPINKDRHGGAKAALFICFMVLMTNMSYAPTFLNLVTYLRGTMHMDVATASTTVTNFFGTTCAFALLGAFISDSYLTRFKTLLLFAPLVILVSLSLSLSLSQPLIWKLGFVMLTLQAYLPSLRPPTCDDTTTSGSGQQSECKQVHGPKAAVLYIALYTIAIGEGSLRANLPPFGADQFDDDNDDDDDDIINMRRRRKSSYFNWLNVCISGGSVMGLTLIVWIESSKGWTLGLALTSAVMLLGLIVLSLGFKSYRYQIPRGSPLTRMLQVLVAAFRKRNLPSPKNEAELYQESPGEEKIGEILSQTKSLKFLDKAAIINGSTTTGSINNNWSLCTVTQVEEMKIIIRMLPIFLSALLAYIPVPQLLTFTIQQGSTMNTKLASGKINVSPVSLLTIPIFFQTIFLIVYDRLFVPIASKITGHRTGITHLQRVGVGFVMVSLAGTIAALIERKRKSIVAAGAGVGADHVVVPMSVLWLGFQFFAIVIIDVFTYVGLLEFFNSEASRGMKSLGTAIFWCILGLSSLLSSTLVELVNRYTAHHPGETGWLGGNDLNHNHLDRFYWLLAILGLVGFFNYLFWATKYVERKTINNVDRSST
ncbi:protein NRT1/ PTR FAMILY 4.5-like [Telopea speciosissima]|uniref:protein NRT1/ PTR FAMILY 4.5-like n=1 Tax=Telopea speciosissima TaxID=54955 RepID=UPI001CC4B15E|nr:protein NRT1/ PTR FAMILY 4.5-like [Telopea speciosissima]